MRRLLFACLLLACRRERSEVRSDPAASAPKRVVCTLPDADPIVTAVEVPARCDLSITKTRHIGPGGTLAISPGAKLAFAPHAGIVVAGGSLVARGTKEEPIVFGSSAAQPKPGDWVGIRFAYVLPSAMVATAASASASASATAAPSSALEHVVVEFAGGEDGTEAPAAIAIGAREEKSVRLAYARIRNNAGEGLHVSGRGFGGGESLVFSDNSGLSMSGSPADVAAVTASTFGDPVKINGEIAKAIVLPPAPAYLTRRLWIANGTPAAPASLTFPEGAVVRFERQGRLEVGRSFGAAGTCALVAKKVTFTSAAAAAKAGDWVGIELHDGCTAAIEDAVVEYAGHASTPKSVVGAIRVPSDDKGISIARTTFKSLGGPALAVESSCKRWGAPAKANVYAGGKLCEEIPSPLAAFGSLATLLAGTDGVGGDVASLLGPGSLGMAGQGGVGVGGLGTGGLGVGGSGGGGSAKVGPGGKVREQSVTTTGKLPNEVVRLVLRARISRLRACYDSGLKATPALAGTISVHLDIDTEGEVTKVASTGGTLTDPTVVSCVTGALRTVSFPSPEAGTVGADATWAFDPP